VESLSQETADPRPIDADGQRWFSELVRERLGEERFYALVAAVREHEATARSGLTDPAEHDLALYARLRLICGEL
jgi:hypothetical protein